MRLYLFVIVLLVGGCATVTRGTETNVQFESSPAGAEVRTQLVDMCAVSECQPVGGENNPQAMPPALSPPIAGPNCSTPCSIRVARKQAVIATFTKPGFEPATVNVALRVADAGAAGLAGNILIGGVIGLGVDAVSGAALEHFPNPVVVTLVPIQQVQAPPVRRR